MDGANMNAQVGLCRPGDIGADVCTSICTRRSASRTAAAARASVPICAAAHLAPVPARPPGARRLRLPGNGPVSAAPLGSASILVISWLYIAMMGRDGLTDATKLAILNANYIAKQLEPHFPVLYRGNDGLVAHECILDLRGFKQSAGVEVEDVAKRLMDYGFHAPTVSWPVAGTMMVEPTESESKEELDRFCDAMIAIHGEIKAIESGEADRKDNVLKHAPHTAAGRDRRRVAARVFAFAGGLPGALDARAQVLAGGGPHRQRVRRPQPVLLLRADGGLRGLK